LSDPDERLCGITVDYHTEKARVTILKENLLDMTTETIMPDIEDINRKSDIWIVRTHSEAVALSKKNAKAWNKECIKTFKTKLTDKDFLSKIVLIMKRDSLNKNISEYRDELDQAYSKKLFGLLEWKNTNTITKTKQFFAKKVAKKYPWDVEAAAMHDYVVIKYVSFFRDKCEAATGSCDNTYLDAFYKAIGITSELANDILEEKCL
jgi:hypothetical protein